MIIVDIRALMDVKPCGVERYIRDFLYELFEVRCRHKSERIILWYNAWGKVTLPEYVAKYAALRGVELIRTRVPNKLLNLCLSLLRWPKLDVFVATAKQSSPSGIVSIKQVTFYLPDLRPAPVSHFAIKILTVHDMSPLRFPQYFSCKSRLWFKLLRIVKEIREADEIWAVSPFTKKEILCFVPGIARKIVVRPSVKYLKMQMPRVSRAQCIAVLKKFALPKKFLFTISTIEPRKEIPRMIETFLSGGVKVACDDLVIAGEENTRIFKKVDLKKYGYSGNGRVPPWRDGKKTIYFLGRISEDEKWCLSQSARAFLWASQYEGYGIPLDEAKLCKLPVSRISPSVVVHKD